MVILQMCIFMNYLITESYGISPRFYAELEQSLVHRDLKGYKRTSMKSVLVLSYQIELAQ